MPKAMQPMAPTCGVWESERCLTVRQRVAFQDNRMADPSRTFTVFQFSVELNSLFGGEILLLQF